MIGRVSALSTGSSPMTAMYVWISATVSAESSKAAIRTDPPIVSTSNVADDNQRGGAEKSAGIDIYSLLNSAELAKGINRHFDSYLVEGLVHFLRTGRGNWIYRNHHVLDTYTIRRFAGRLGTVATGDTSPVDRADHRRHSRLPDAGNPSRVDAASAYQSASVHWLR